MEFFKNQTHVDFMGARKITTFISAMMIIATLISLFVYGINFGLDFTGGTQIIVKYERPVDLPTIRQQLAHAGYADAIVQAYGSNQELSISLPQRMAQSQQQITEKIQQVLPEAKFHRVDVVGPQVGNELVTKGFLAVIVALICIMIYIALRFEIRFAVSAVIALIHDPVVILGFFSFFQWEFNLIALAGLLTILGYSLNDTIVVFDRVRENFRRMRKASTAEVMNLSINQTLSRTLVTSGLTLLVVIALLIFGGEALRGFSIALFIGIIVGTYSSIYIAGALAMLMGLSRKDLILISKEEMEARP